MVTKNEQMAPIVKPNTAILIAVAFVVIGIIAFFMASGLKSAPTANTASTSTYTQDSGNQPGTANNSMSAGGTSQEIKGSPGQNNVLPSK
jgi:hypothetical protein